MNLIKKRIEREYKEIMELRKQNDIAINLNVSLRTVKRLMEILQDDKIIERVGSKKTGSWKVKK